MRYQESFVSGSSLQPYTSGKWPVLSLDVLFENKIQREVHCVLIPGYVR